MKRWFGTSGNMPLMRLRALPIWRRRALAKMPGSQAHSFALRASPPRAHEMKGRPRTTILERSLHERPWGRDDLPFAYHASGRRIGEVWHQHPDARLPVLVK